MRRAVRRTICAFALSACACGAVLAGGLQVSPVSLRLEATQNAEGMTLSNAGSERVQAQVRVYQWTQSEGKDQLAPSRGLVISPPMLDIEPGAQQLIRVIRTGPPPAGPNEETYRLAIDELPGATSNKTGLQFVLHYSVPVFILPQTSAPLAHQLSWKLVESGGKVELQVANAGPEHAQLARLSYTSGSGKRIVIQEGLLGYVLPGATMRWPLNQPATAFAGSGTLEALVNGAQVAQQNLTLVNGSK